MTTSRSAEPAVSIVMPVHNALPHLDAAVRSILAQSFRDFEFVIQDDGSTDGSLERLRYWAEQDPRIRVFESERNLGPALSSNLVVTHALSELVARMDADDISHPDRIAQEVEVLRAHPEVGLVGTLCDIIDAEGRLLRGPEPWRLSRKAWSAPFPHGSIMFRRSLFEKIGGYRERCEYWEDQDLVIRMAAQTEIMVIARALYQHRQSPASTRIASDQERVERAVDLMYRSVGNLREKRGYDELLASAEAPSGKIDPRVFISLGSLTLWAGGHPRLFRRLLKRGRLRPDFNSTSAILWTAWADASPATLRAMLKLLVRLRNIRGRKLGTSEELVRWRPPAPVT